MYDRRLGEVAGDQCEGGWTPVPQEARPRHNRSVPHVRYAVVFEKHTPKCFKGFLPPVKPDGVFLKFEVSKLFFSHQESPRQRRCMMCARVRRRMSWRSPAPPEAST